MTLSPNKVKRLINKKHKRVKTELSIAQKYEIINLFLININIH